MQNKCCPDKKVSGDGNKEYIMCPTCRNKVTDLTLIRCPRCYGSLLKFGCDGNCGSCSAKG